MSIWKSFCRQVESKPVRRHFVRVTKTMLVDIGGGKWSRKHGKRRHCGYSYQLISDADLDKIEVTVSRRDKVDIVADRKMIAEGLADA